MPESIFERRKLRNPELDNIQISMDRTKSRQSNNYLRKYNDELELRYSSAQIQSQEKQHPILNLYSNTKQAKKETKSLSMSSRIFSSSSNKGLKKDLGHDLDQLTRNNQHEVNLTPHPSLTIMVQPNKIDYSERSTTFFSTALNI